MNAIEALREASRLTRLVERQLMVTEDSGLLFCIHDANWYKNTRISAFFYKDHENSLMFDVTQDGPVLTSEKGTFTGNKEEVRQILADHLNKDVDSDA